MSETAVRTVLNDELAKLWNEYAKRYNSLSKKLQKAGIESGLLEEVIVAARELDRHGRLSLTYKQSPQESGNVR